VTVGAFLDTSMIVRYLTGEPPELAEVAAAVIDREDDLLVTDVALVETAYVLTSVYRIPRETVVDYLIAFLRKENISTFGLDEGTVLRALLLCKPSGRVSFPDAMIWAVARGSRERRVYTLDERFPGEDIELGAIPR